MGIVELEMGIGAGMILWVSAFHFREFVRTQKPRYLVAAIFTLPAALMLLSIVLGGI